MSPMKAGAKATTCSISLSCVRRSYLQGGVGLVDAALDDTAAVLVDADLFKSVDDL